MKHILGVVESENGQIREERVLQGEIGCEPEEETLKILIYLKETLTTQERSLLREENLRITKKQLAASVTPADKVIRASRLAEEIDRSWNALARQLRAWYRLYNPELEHEVQGHDDLLERIAKGTPQGEMGGEFSKGDLEQVGRLADELIRLKQERERLASYIEETMRSSMPNLTHVAGPFVGSQLLSLAGSLRRLAMMPAGTIQVLGAEGALFKHLRKGTRPPKHGVIFNHKVLQRAPRAAHGKVAVALANGIGIAARIDYFGGEFAGDALLAKAERAAK